eukprot:m.81122 g.81122  ORF g.81122 m.81122 type:complete len:485 (+) comp8642_c1_seq7:95-1549(+)
MSLREEDAKEDLVKMPEPCGVVQEEHPHGVQPLGMAFVDGVDVTARRTASLGKVFERMDDEQVVELIFSYLDAATLCKAACVSQYWYAFATFEETWRELCVKLHEEKRAPFKYDGSWRSSYKLMSGQLGEAGDKEATSKMLSTFKLHNVYSDFLFDSWYYSAVDIDAAWLVGEDVSIEPADITLAEFVKKHEMDPKPVVIKGYAKKWPAYKEWRRGGLANICGERTLKAGDVNVCLSDFDTYMHHHEDQRPLYIFDKKYHKKIPELKNAHTAPSFLPDDVFKYCGETRPSNRWVIVGPAKSGSAWHIDPNSTTAWNALIEGQKRWIMTPPNQPPPGVHPSPDGAAVASPISVLEWFVSYYDALKESGIPYIEFTQNEGDVVYVPWGWWHIVLNTKPSIAITQNLATPSSLYDTLRFLRTRKDQISGVAEGIDLYSDLCNGIEKAGRKDLQIIVEEEKSDDQVKDNRPPKKAKTATISTFSFGFS